MIQYKSFLYVAALLVVLFFGHEVQAVDSADDTFRVSIFMGTDDEAPTVPGNFSVTPVATNQIDLDWDASSDNLSVAGYQVFRDSVQIATTTLTAFSDTGLAPSTLYAYFVTAFDTSLNISSSTAILSTSTLAVPAPPATTTPTTTAPQQSGRGRSQTEITIENFRLTAFSNAFDISFSTNVYTNASIRWGRSSAFESGYVISDSLKREHKTRIDGLESGVQYWLEIVVTNEFGQEVVYRTRATTTATADGEAPTNVSNFSARLLGEEVRLAWDNPSINDFAKVRVLSSDYFYPTHTADGWLVYEGTSEQIFDNRPLLPGQGRYYTIFVYDAAGNISSGAVTQVFRPRVGQPSIPETIASTTEIISEPPPGIEFAFVEFLQTGLRLQPSDTDSDVVTLMADTDTLIRIPYDRLPENLKTILISLTDPNTGKQFAFLLRVNKDKSYYEATIGPLERGGRFLVEVSVFDFKAQTLAIATGTIESIEQPVVITESELSSSLAWIVRFDWLLLALVSLLLLLLLFWYRKQRSALEDKIV